MSRLAHWLRRYLPAEAASLVGALLAAQMVWELTANPAAAAIAGAWGENVLYYGVMLTRELRATHHLGQAARNLVLEFGVAEALDSGLVRPVLMYLAAQLVADVALGTILGKFAADIVFYVPAIASYELRRRYTRGKPELEPR